MTTDTQEVELHPMLKELGADPDNNWVQLIKEAGIDFRVTKNDLLDLISMMAKERRDAEIEAVKEEYKELPTVEDARKEALMRCFEAEMEVMKDAVASLVGRGAVYDFNLRYRKYGEPRMTVEYKFDTFEMSHDFYVRDFDDEYRKTIAKLKERDQRIQEVNNKYKGLDGTVKKVRRQICLQLLAGNEEGRQLLNALSTIGNKRLA